MIQIDKKELIKLIQGSLQEELNVILESAKSAYQAATNEESKAEDQYDTRGLEASYLAGAQAQRASELERTILIYRFLPVMKYTNADLVEPGALVELELNKKKSMYFLVPQGGGLVTEMNGMPIQVITPQSPLGEELLGQKVGATFEVESRGGVREYKIISIQ